MAKYLKPYQQAVKSFGTEFEALLWNSEQMQTRRFQAMADTVALAGRRIADLGTGRADFLAYLVAQGIEYGRFVGVEGVEELKDFCEKRSEEAHWRDASFIHADFAADDLIFQRLVRERGVDTLTFSGSLNTFGEKLAKKTLHRAWSAIERTKDGAVLFNFLSDQRKAKGDSTGPAKRFNTLDMIRWAFERTSLVAVRHDYLGDHDCLIVMRSG